MYLIGFAGSIEGTNYDFYKQVLIFHLIMYVSFCYHGTIFSFVCT